MGLTQNSVESPPASADATSELGPCRNHADAQGRWRCAGCGGQFCDGCVRRLERDKITVVFCPDCAGKCDDLHETLKPPPPDFYAQLRSAWRYPLAGPGKYIIAAGACFFWLAGGAAAIAGFIPYAGPVCGLIIGLFFACYLCAYAFDVISDSASGGDQPPEWPDMTDIYSDVLKPGLLMIAAFAVPMLPAIVARIIVYAEYEDVTPPAGALAPSLLLSLVGSFLVPMALLGIAMFRGSAGLHPLVLLGGIARTMPAYLLTWAALAGAGALYVFVTKPILSYVPVLGPFVGHAVSLYLLLGGMRTLGLLYRHHEHRLGWFDGV